MVPKLPKGFTHPMKIGGGAFASVYRVRQATLKRWVALKLIEEKDNEKRGGLLKEATTQAQLRIRCIPQVFDAFEWKSFVCIVMQWIRGVSLAELLRHSLSDAQGQWIAEGLIRALADLHAQGYAHRDLKPENVIISAAEGVFLLDFGFTKNMREMEKSVSGVIKGTPAYMAPELWRQGGEVDHIRADVYSTGRMLKEVLGSHEAASIADTLLSEDPAQRPASCTEVLSLWTARYGDRQSQARWDDLARAIASALHAQNLLDAARELLSARRYDEAYWLLVECLEESPEMVEALDLMNDFPVLARGRKKRRNAAVALAVCAALALAVVAFVVGRGSRDWSGSDGGQAQASRRPETTLFKASRAPHTLPASLPAFHEDSLSGSRLCGYVLLKSYPAEGTLHIDGKPFLRRTELRDGIAVPFGMHTLAWHIAGRGIVWRERAFVLPFQVKGLSVRQS